MPTPLTPSPAQDKVAIRYSRNPEAEWHSASLYALAPMDVPAPLRFWHLASLDAPTVAVVWSLAFAWAAHVQLPLWVIVLILLGVWVVYVGDRLLDAHRGLRTVNLQNLRERHLFHWRNRRMLLPLAIAAATASTTIIFNFMPVGVRERNSVLVAASLVYFTRVHTGRNLSAVLSKEFLVGILFTAGCALPAWSRVTLEHRTMLWPLLIPFAAFAALAWLNCYAIDRWEAGSDSSSRSSISFHAGILALSCGLLCTTLLVSHPRSSVLLASAMMSALLLVQFDRVRSRLTPVTLRATADLVLLTPLLLIPCAAAFHL